MRGAGKQRGGKQRVRRRESEGIGGAALATWPARGRGFFFGIMVTSDLSSLIPAPFNMRLLPD